MLSVRKCLRLARKVECAMKGSLRGELVAGGLSFLCSKIFLSWCTAMDL